MDDDLGVLGAGLALLPEREVVMATTEVPSFRNGKLTEFELNAMTPLQRQVLEILCDACNWTSCFVHVFESPHHDGWTFSVLTRSNGTKIECVHIEGSNRY